MEHLFYFTYCFTTGLYVAVLFFGAMLLMHQPWIVGKPKRNRRLCVATTFVMIFAVVDMVAWIVNVSLVHLGLVFYNIRYNCALDCIYFGLFPIVGEVLLWNNRVPLRNVLWGLVLPVIVSILLVTARFPMWMEILMGVMLVYILAVLLYQLVLLLRRERDLKNRYTQIETHSNVWYVHIMLFFIVQVLSYFACILYNRTHAWLYVLYCGVSVVVWAYLVSNVLKVDMDAEPENEPEPLPQEEQTQNHAFVPAATVEEAGNFSAPKPEWVDTLQRVMEEKQPYLESDLNIDTLSHLVGTNRTYLSDYISHVLHVSFFDYVNAYRLDYAIRLMREDANSKLEIIALQSGFISSRAMRNAFMTKFGCTPSEYRAQMK